MINRPGNPHPVCSELQNSRIRVAVGDCSVTERRRWRPPTCARKTIVDTNTSRTDARRRVCAAIVPYRELDYTSRNQRSHLATKIRNHHSLTVSSWYEHASIELIVSFVNILGTPPPTHKAAWLSLSNFLGAQTLRI